MSDATPTKEVIAKQLSEQYAAKIAEEYSIPYGIEESYEEEREKPMPSLDHSVLQTRLIAGSYNMRANIQLRVN